MNKWEWRVVGLALLGLTVLYFWPAPKPEAAAVTTGLQRGGGRGPAPTLKRVAPRKVQGKLMPEAWRTIDPQPGDETYIGTYVEDVEGGLYNGKKSYVLHKGEANERWIYAGSNGFGYIGIQRFPNPMPEEFSYSTNADTYENPGHEWWVGAGGVPLPPTFAPVQPVRPKHGLLYRSGPHLKGVT